MGIIIYSIEIEIFKGNDCGHHRIRQKFKYPEDIGKICPWLLGSNIRWPYSGLY